MRNPKQKKSPNLVSTNASAHVSNGHKMDAVIEDNRSSAIAQRKLQGVVQKEGDPIEAAVLDTNSESVKKDVDAAMLKIKAKIISEAQASEQVASALKGSGRDWMIYAPFSSWWKGMLDLLSSWENSWSLEDTAGLLLDIGGALRKVTSQVDNGKGIMNEYMDASRKPDKTANQDSDWNKDLPANTKVQAGVSATTGNLLSLLRHLDVNSVNEIEALMNGVILYWKNSKLKNALGQFHTAAEVWTAYTYHIEQYTDVAKKKADDND